MAINPSNVIQGPATIYWGAFGVTEPADTNAALIAAPGAGWTDMGATTGGVTVSVEHTYGQIKADQLVDSIGARLTGRTITVAMSLLEATLQNLLVAMNQAGNIATPASGISTFDPTTATSATQPTYTALLVDGWAPTLGTGAAARRRIIVRKLLSDVKASAKYDLVTQVTWDCTFTAYYVSNSIAPFHIQDQTS
jgi:hypothetical protein